MRARSLLLLLLLAACAGRDERPVSGPPQGSVGMSLASVPAAERLHLASNERFQYPLPHPGNRLPEYPEALLAERLGPQVVCVSVSIGEVGEVFRIDPMQDGEDCAATADAPPELRQVVFDAIGFWRFEAAFRCVYPEGVQPSNLACMPPGEVVHAAIRMPYRFVFEQRDGKGIVSSD